jgi:hypothetical protein
MAGAGLFGWPLATSPPAPAPVRSLARMRPVRCPLSAVRCPLSVVRCSGSDAAPWSSDEPRQESPSMPLRSGNNYLRQFPPTTTRTNPPAGNGPTEGSGARATSPVARGSSSDERFSSIPSRRARSSSPADEPQAQRPRRESPVRPERSAAAAASQPAVAWPGISVSGSALSRSTPRSLEDLPAWRQPLLDAPADSLSRQFGERLRALQQERGSGTITHPAFLEQAQTLVDELFDRRHDFDVPDHHRIANDDIGLQYVRFRAAADGYSSHEDLESLPVEYRAALASWRIDHGVHPRQAMQGLGHFDQERLDQLQELANAEALSWIERGGASAAEMMDRFGVPESGRARLEAADADFETHGPRADQGDLLYARFDIEADIPVEQVAATHGLTHPRDIADLHEWRIFINEMRDGE